MIGQSVLEVGMHQKLEESLRHLHGFSHIGEVLTSFRNMSSLDVLFSSSSFLPWTRSCCSASVQTESLIRRTQP